MLHAVPDVSRSRKAAMVVQLLLRDGEDLPLSQLPPSAQARLTKELAELKIIDKATLESVADEFASALEDIGLLAPGSVEAALQSLDGRISEDTAARLREEAGLAGGADPWAAVLALTPEDMLPITEAESPEISAILLSKMTTASAATLLGLMPGERARRIAYAMSKTTAVKSVAIERIGSGLAQNYCGGVQPVFADSPESRVGAILNSSPPTTRDQVLEGLISEDPIFGEGVRKKIFTFQDIKMRVAANDVPKILRDIDGGDLIRALASATHEGGQMVEVARHLLDNMSKRMADNLREEMAEVGKVKKSDAEAAQTAVVTAIRAAADEGTITLIVEGEDDE